MRRIVARAGLRGFRRTWPRACRDGPRPCVRSSPRVPSSARFRLRGCGSDRSPATGVRTKESGMYARVVIYTHDDDKDELEAKARAGVIPIVTSTPGYISYGVMFDEDRVVSISQWESE